MSSPTTRLVYMKIIISDDDKSYIGGIILRLTPVFWGYILTLKVELTQEAGA